MTWSDFYLICFSVGFCFSFFSFIFGGRIGRLHLPHVHGHGFGDVSGAHGPIAHGPLGHGSAASVSARVAQGGGVSRGTATRGGGVSPFNPPTMAAFLAWFGGTGYLLTRFSAIWVGFGLMLSVVAGVMGGGIIFLFLSKFLLADEEYLDPADFEMVGVLGKLSMPIRQGGTGELIYSQMGTRRVCGARSDDDSVLAKGAEVVVTRYEKGIAYVRLFSEMSGETDEVTTTAK